MKTRATRLAVGVAIFSIASLVSIDLRPLPASPSQSATAVGALQVSLSVTPRAEAFIRRLFRRIGRAFRRVARAFRRVGRAIGRGFKKMGRAIGKGFKKVGRAVGKGFKKMGRAMGKGFKKVGRAMGKGFKKGGRAMGKGFKKVGRAIAKAAKSVGKGVWKGVKTMGKGFVKMGKGVAKVAKGVGKTLVGVGKAVGKFTKGTFQAAGKFFKGDIKGARRSFVGGAKSAGRAVVSGAKRGWKDIKKGAGQVLSGAKDVASGALDVITLGQKDKILALIKKVMSSRLFQVVVKIATKLLDKLGGLLGSSRLVKALKIVRSVLSVGHQIVTAIHNPGLYLQAGREAAIERLADLAMQVLTTPIRKLAGAAMGTLISLGKHFVTVPLSAAIASALASVTFGIGAGLAPLIKLGIDRFLEWAIAQITDKLAGLALKIGAIRNFLKNKLIKPVINKLYDKLITLIRNKVPALAKKLTTSAEHEAGVRPEALVKGLGGVAQVLGKAAKVARQVEGIARKAQRAKKARKSGRKAKARTPARKPTRVARKVSRPAQRPTRGVLPRGGTIRCLRAPCPVGRAPRKVARRPTPRPPGGVLAKLRRIVCVRPPCPRPKAARKAPVPRPRVVAMPWYRRPGACPDGWRLLKFDGSRVHCLAAAQNRGRCARISVFTQSYDRCGWASGCGTRWTSAGCRIAPKPTRAVVARRPPARPRVVAKRQVPPRPRVVARPQKRALPRVTTARPPVSRRGTLSDLQRGLQQAYREASRARIAALTAARALAGAARSLPARARILRAVAAFRRGIQGAYRIVYAMRSRVRRALGALSGERLRVALEALGSSSEPLPALERTGPALPTARAALVRLLSEGRRYVHVSVAVLPALAAMRDRFERAAQGAQSGLREAADTAGKGTPSSSGLPAS